jgi:secretin/TonB-like protein
MGSRGVFRKLRPVPRSIGRTGVMLQSSQNLHKRDRARSVTRSGSARRSIPWAFAIGFVGVAATADLAFCQTSPTHSPQQFNIPSQPLEAALNRYGDATGREALYDARLAAGRVSGDVTGVLAPDEALKRLLAGTGLAAQFVAENAFVLLLISPPREQVAKTMSSADRRYYGLIQANLLSALCRSRVVRLGHYRFVAIFWIAPDGRIERPRRIGSAGSTDADQQIDAALGSVKFSEPPPSGFAQPVLILIVPQAQGVAPGCSRSDSALGSAEVP